MRNTRLVGLVVAALASTASFVGAQSSAPDAARAARVEKGVGARGELLRGITLTGAEKSKLKELRKRDQTETKSLRASLRPAMLEARAARQKGDTAAARAILARTKGDREKLQALTERQKADFRAALTPEHQKQFDANVQQAAQRRHGAKGKAARVKVGGRQKKVRPTPNG